MKSGNKLEVFWLKHKILIVVVAAIVGVSAVFGGMLISHGKQRPAEVIKGVNEQKSQIMVTGKNYSIDDEGKDKEDKKSDKKSLKDNNEKQDDNLDLDIDNQINEDKKEVAPSKYKKKVKSNKKVNFGNSGNSSGNGSGSGNKPGSGDKPNGGEEVNDNEASKAPQIECTLQDGGTYELYEGQSKIFTVTVKDYKNNILRASNYNVYINGDSERLYSIKSGPPSDYKFAFKEGKNTIRIDAVDKDDNKGSRLITIYVSRSAHKIEQGTAIVKIDASQVGAGVLLYKDEVPIYEGDTVKEILERAKENSGISWETRNNGTYIFAVSKPGLLAGKFDGNTPTPEFAEFLLKKLADMGSSITTINKGEVGRLANGELTKNSGWVYTLNGEPGDVAVTGKTIGDGDEINFFFTLDFDIDTPFN